MISSGLTPGRDKLSRSGCHIYEGLLMPEHKSGPLEPTPGRATLVRICPAPHYLEAFRTHAALDGQSFDAQIVSYRKANLMLPGGWAAAMGDEGFDVFETFADDAKLQKIWAEENGIALSTGDHSAPGSGHEGIDILIAQVRLLQPEVIFIYAGAFGQISRDIRDSLRAVCQRNVLIVGFWGDELPANGGDYAAFLGDLDFVFCANSSYAKTIKAAGIPAQVLGNCFDDSIEYTKPGAKSRDFIFCGTTGYGYPDHIRRYEWLKALMPKTTLELWTSEPRIPIAAILFGKPLVAALRWLPSNMLRGVKNLARGFGLQRVARAMALGLSMKHDRSAAKTAMGGLFHPKKNYFVSKKSLAALHPRRANVMLPDCGDYYALLAGAKLVLNIHRDEDADFGNIRCFEATGLGACLVTDRGAELAEFFDIENELVAFDSWEECVEKVTWLLDHPSEIARISGNGQRATRDRHTVAVRCKVIAETLRMLQSAGASGQQ
jgi:hypothetical protein